MSPNIKGPPIFPMRKSEGNEEIECVIEFWEPG
jgi:hypothetical protein